MSFGIGTLVKHSGDARAKQCLEKLGSIYKLRYPDAEALRACFANPWICGAKTLFDTIDEVFRVSFACYDVPYYHDHMAPETKARFWGPQRLIRNLFAVRRLNDRGEGGSKVWYGPKSTSFRIICPEKFGSFLR